MHHVPPKLERQKGEQHLIFVRRPSAVATCGEAAESSGPLMDSIQSLVVVLRVFDLCNCGTDDTICKEDLESALMPFLGQSDDVNDALRLLNEALHSDSDTCRFDFLSYWYGMEHLFSVLGSRPTAPARHGEEDAVQGMQRLRDGVREACKRSPTHEISVSCLHDLVAKIRTESRTPQQWDDRFLKELCLGNVTAVPRLDISRVLCQRLRVHMAQAQAETLRESGILSMDPEARCRLGVEASLSPTNRQRSRGSHDFCAFASEDLQRAHELVEVLHDITKKEQVAAHAAIDQLWALCEKLARTVQCQEADRLRLRSSSQESAAKLQKKEQELRHAKDAFESEDRELRDLNEAMKETIQEKRRRIHSLERKLRTNKEECESSHCEQSKLKTVERECELWRSRCTQLQRAVDNAEAWQWENAQRRAAEDAEARCHQREQEESSMLRNRLTKLEEQLSTEQQKLSPLQDENSKLHSHLAKLEKQLCTEQKQHQESLKELSAARQHAQEAVFQAAVASNQKFLHNDEEDLLEIASTAGPRSVASSSFLTTSTNWGDDWFSAPLPTLKRSPKKKLRTKLAEPAKIREQ